jgi:hypothetical protein
MYPSVHQQHVQQQQPVQQPQAMPVPQFAVLPTQPTSTAPTTMPTQQLPPQYLADLQKLLHQQQQPPSQQQQQPQQLQPLATAAPSSVAPSEEPTPSKPLTIHPPVGPTTLSSLLENANVVSDPDRAQIIRFFEGNTENPDPSRPVRQFFMSRIVSSPPDEANTKIQQLWVEINYETLIWRKIVRRKTLPGSVAAALAAGAIDMTVSAQQPMIDTQTTDTQPTDTQNDD